MKQSVLLAALLFHSFQSFAAGWANCGGSPQTEPILDVFWKSDAQGGNGPDYTLKSGQTFSNIAALCREGQVLKTSDWITELKKGINPAKSISSFQEIHNADEVQNFLKNHSIEVDDFNRLNETVTAFLQSQPVNYESSSSMPGKASHPVMLVGASGEEAVLVLASSDGKDQYAAAIQFRLRH